MTLGSDFSRALQLVRTRSVTWMAREDWQPDAFRPGERRLDFIGGASFCLPDGFTSTFGVTEVVGASAMTRLVGVPDGILMANAYPQVNGPTRVLVRTVQTCPLTFNEPSKEFNLTDAARQPGASTDPNNNALIMMNPVSSTAVGLLYVTTAGSLRYIE